MKSTVSNQSCTKENPYPKLMYFEGDENFIVLFSEKEKGIVVSSGEDEDWRVGEFSDTWRSNNFVDFNGSVCLENDK